MKHLRRLLAAAGGLTAEGDVAFWTAESLGLIEVVRYLPGGQVQWRRTAAGERRVRTS